MEDESFTLVVEGLDKIEALEAEEECEGLVPQLAGDNDRELGEPGTILLIGAIGAVALPPLLVWLGKRKEWFRFSDAQEMTLPDGTKVKRTIKISTGAVSPPTAEELEKLGAMSGNSADHLSALLKLTEGK